MRSNRRSKNRLMNDINVVPYIDVMLVLLVIFMVTAPMMNPGQVDLPGQQVVYPRTRAAGSDYKKGQFAGLARSRPG
jgi:biopolymer transport protein TolR